MKKDPIAGLKGLLFIVFVGCIWWFTPKCDSEKKEEIKHIEPIKTKEELRDEKIRSEFSVWDGSHINLEKVIKKSLNDPESYKHIETSYSDNKDYVLVKTVYSSKNGFGGVIKQSVWAKSDTNGNVIEILKQQ